MGRGRDVFKLLAWDLLFRWEDHSACCFVADGLVMESQPDASVLQLRVFRPGGSTHPMPVA